MHVYELPPFQIELLEQPPFQAQAPSPGHREALNRKVHSRAPGPLGGYETFGADELIEIAMDPAGGTIG